MQCMEQENLGRQCPVGGATPARFKLSNKKVAEVCTRPSEH